MEIKGKYSEKTEIEQLIERKPETVPEGGKPKEFCIYCMGELDENGQCPACGFEQDKYVHSPHHLPPRTMLLNRYMTGRVLGEGGFGITYIGMDTRLEIKVAIKEYFPSEKVTRNSLRSLEVTNYTGARGEDFTSGKARFLQEARTMARMDKLPEIVGVRDYFEANNTAYIVMEYVEGTTFKALIEQRGKIPMSELLPMIEPLFTSLQKMHEIGLIHRDISPDNIMIEKGKIRLLDFGCARETLGGAETMSIVLKHGYAPVEQYQHGGQGPWTDVYAFAATIYYCIVGDKPPQALDRIMNDVLEPPSKKGAELTKEQERALMYAMGKKPRHRYQSMQEFHDALYHGKASQRQRKIALIAAACSVAAALLIIGVAVAIFLNAAKTPETEPAPEPTVSSSEAVAAMPTPRPADYFLKLYAAEVDWNLWNVNSAYARTEEEFFTALDDHAVNSVIVDSELVIENTDRDVILLEKPLLITTGGHLITHLPIVVRGEKGRLMANNDGRLDTTNYLRTTYGGRCYNKCVGEQAGISAKLLIVDDIFRDYAGAFYADETIILNETRTAQDAVHISTQEELQKILDNGAAVGAVCIDGDVDLADGNSEEYRCAFDIVISEGVTVNVPKTWIMDDVYLINNGVIKGDGTLRLNHDLYSYTGGNVFINNGEVDMDGWFCLDYNYILVNCGKMTVLNGTSMESSVVHNLGEMTFGSEYDDKCIYNMYATVHNYGDISVRSGTHFRELENARKGSIVCERAAWLDKRVVNSGLIRVKDGGSIINNGLMINDFGEIDCPQYAFENNGAVIREPWSNGADSLADMGIFSSRLNISNEEPQDITSEDELRAAMSENTDRLLRITKKIDVYGDITITRNILFEGVGMIDMFDNGNFIVDGAVILGQHDDINLDVVPRVQTNGLELRNGAYYHGAASVVNGEFIIGADGTACAYRSEEPLNMCDERLYVGPNSIAYVAAVTEGSDIDVEGAFIYDSYATPPSMFKRLNINGGKVTFFTDNSLESQVEINIDSDGVLRFAGRIDSIYGKINNDGLITSNSGVEVHLWHSEDGHPLEIDNRGRMDITDGWEIGVVIRNAGEIAINATEPKSIVLTGEIVNDGVIRSTVPDPFDIQYDGKITGNDITVE